MKQTIKSQVQNILDKKGYIANRWCWDNYITPRLGAYINLLRNEGKKIATVEQEKRDKYDCRYYLLDTDGEPIRKIPKGYKITFEN